MENTLSSVIFQVPTMVLGPTKLLRTTEERMESTFQTAQKPLLCTISCKVSQSYKQTTWDGPKYRCQPFSMLQSNIQHRVLRKTEGNIANTVLSMVFQVFIILKSPEAPVVDNWGEDGSILQNCGADGAKQYLLRGPWRSLLSNGGQSRVLSSVT